MYPFQSNANNEPQNYTIKDKQLLCHHCNNDLFVTNVAVIHWAGGLLNQKATCFICTECNAYALVQQHRMTSFQLRRKSVSLSLHP